MEDTKNTSTEQGASTRTTAPGSALGQVAWAVVVLGVVGLFALFALAMVARMVIPNC